MSLGALLAVYGCTLMIDKHDRKLKKMYNIDKSCVLSDDRVSIVHFDNADGHMFISGVSGVKTYHCNDGDHKITYTDKI